MKRMFWMGVVVVSLVGCNLQTGLYPVDSVIEQSSERDFGFEGTWVPVSTEDKFDDDSSSFELLINRDQNYTAKLVNVARDESPSMKAEFRTHEISENRPHAIIEIEMKEGATVAHRRLAVAATKGDLLYLWYIDGKRVGEYLYKDGVGAVIEHSSFSSSIRCDSEKLLKCLSNCLSSVVEHAAIFRRKIDDNTAQ